MDKFSIKKSEMKSDLTYLLCPDRNCRLFWKPDCFCPCEYDCPRQEELIKMVYCDLCDAIIELPGDSSFMKNTTHPCKDGRTAVLFTRMSGKHRIIYEKPLSD